MASGMSLLCRSLLALLLFCLQTHALPLNTTTLDTQALPPGPGIVISGCTTSQEEYIRDAYSKDALELLQEGQNYPLRSSPLSGWFFGSFAAHADFVSTHSSARK